MLLGDGWFRRLVEELHSNQVPPPVAAWKALSKTAMARFFPWEVDQWGRMPLGNIMDMGRGSKLGQSGDFARHY